MAVSSGQSDAANTYISAESTGLVPDNGSLHSENLDPQDREQTGESLQMRDDVVVRDASTSDIHRYRVDTPTPPDSVTKDEIYEDLGNELETSTVPSDVPKGPRLVELQAVSQDLDRQLRKWKPSSTPRLPSCQKQLPLPST